MWSCVTQQVGWCSQVLHSELLLQFNIEIMYLWWLSETIDPVFSSSQKSLQTLKYCVLWSGYLREDILVLQKVGRRFKKEKAEGDLKVQFTGLEKGRSIKGFMNEACKFTKALHAELSLALKAYRTEDFCLLLFGCLFFNVCKHWVVKSGFFLPQDIVEAEKFQQVKKPIG